MYKQINWPKSFRLKSLIVSILLVGASAVMAAPSGPFGTQTKTSAVPSEGNVIYVSPTGSGSGTSLADPTSLEEQFRSPPDASRPWCYWYWISNNISKEGVTKDLEAMARVGIGTALIGNQWFRAQPKGSVPILSEAWWDITVHAVREGQRLGVDIGFFNCPGWSMSGGPWVKPEEAMRYLASSEIRVSGPKIFSEKLPIPGANFQDVALIAIPVSADDDSPLSERKPQVVCSPEAEQPEYLTDGDIETGVNLPAKTKVQVDIAVSTPFTARSVVLTPGIGNFRTMVEVQAWIDGAYQTIREVKYDRRNDAGGVGPMPKGPVMVALPPTKTDRFRLLFSPRQDTRGSEKMGTIAEIDISSRARVEYAIEKQLGKMFPKPLPLWGDYLWPDAPDPENTAMALDPASVINLTGRIDEEGLLTCKIPNGDWIIQRIGMLPTGVKNDPAAPNASGLEVDKMNRTHLAGHFDAYVGELLRRLSPKERKTLKYIVGDSYEKGPQNWTDGLSEIFEQTYGYDPVPFLPTLSGRVVQSAEASDRFLWDLRRLVADRVAEEYVGGLRDLCHENNMQLWLENYGHWGFPGEFMRYGGECDLVAGEFWVTGTLGNIECRAAASTAHAYGKPVVYAEAFTSGANWEYAPFDLKARGDWAFTEGINHFVLHLYIQQPDDDFIPGMNAWFGTEFNRHNTWFEEGRDWMDYLRRCHVLLQQGLHVADFAYFIGEDAPIMTGTRQPEQPAGYDFDFINAEVLLERMTVKAGRWTLPDGKSYSVLVLPPLDTMRPAVIQKLSELQQAGGVLYGKAPVRSPSLQNAAEADQIVTQCAKGMTFHQGELQQVVDSLKLPPDVSNINPKNILWTHRQTPEMEIYFVSNQEKKSVDIQPTFRVFADWKPEFWHADSGLIERMGEYTCVKNGTQVPLTLGPAGSIFVVFRHPSAAVELPAKVEVVGEPKIISLTENAWILSLMPGRDVPEEIELKKAGWWTELDDIGVQHYSGTGQYRTTFSIPEKELTTSGIRYVLDLGEVGEIARVWLNGTDLGLLWKPPFRVDLTSALRSGENELEIDVTNLWSNRMMAEDKYPDGFPNHTGNTTFHPRSSTSNAGLAKRALQPSGLAGPVVIECQHVESMRSKKEL